ncbi:uncharacterized protein LOC131016805 [Salvia miltiorrhiza]|uniref:uncharacterized protein LOC131016805 n=1 Tax=Salvia miltiorrhiza TaxID=226208 RepID=UPI0025AD6C4C|nr:uncharacterized protein LOC131016805 [Salvia miltiorrhiza]
MCSMAPPVLFIFNFWGVWKKDEDSGDLIHDGYNSVELEDSAKNMTFDRINDEYEKIYGSKPSKVYACDEDYKVENGLVHLRDSKHCHKVLDYFELVNQEQVHFFADHDRDPMPSITPLALFPDDSADDNLDGEGAEPTSGGEHNDGEDLGNVTGVEGAEEAEGEQEAEGELDEGDSDDSSVFSQESSESEEENNIQMIGSVEDGQEGSFSLGMTFADAKDAKDAIHAYGVKFGYKLKFLKNEPKRIRVVCMNEVSCPFVILVSKDGDIEGLMVKTLVADHTCNKQREVPSVSQGYLAKYFKNAVYRNPKFTSKDMQGHVKEHLKLHVSLHKCKRAKRDIITNLEGSYKEEFNRLCAYIEKVKEVMPGTKMELGLSAEQLENNKRVFKRLFVMLEPLKQNWLGGCRKFICLDGCHLKGVTFGCLLTAVGKDGNDGIVPIAWAVVNKENKSNWTWFMRWLKQELHLDGGDHITIMSDMQKGLMEAVKDITPYAEHRWCARHIYANWSKKWRGEEMKKRFWIAAWSSFEEEFKLNMVKLRGINRKAHDELLHYPPANWCRAYQSTRCSTNMVDNNCSESFNSSISDARYKPIISMLEDIRLLAMKRISDRKSAVQTWKTVWSPNALKFYEANKIDSGDCNVVWNGEYGYEVSEGEDRHIVKVDRKTCTCRGWDLTGIPCSHAIAAFFSSSMDPLLAISQCYHRDSYAKAYEHLIKPLPGVKFWNVKDEDAIEPPPVEKKIGRPKKNRVRAPNEPKRKHKLSRVGKTQHCSLCRSANHKKGACALNPTKVNKDAEASTSAKSKGKAPAGLGLYVDLDTGTQILNPGGSQSIVINDDTPNVRFAIPNERELRMEKRMEKRKRENSTAAGENSKTKKTTTKPFKPPRGKDQEQQQEPVLRRSPRRLNVISTAGSTTSS